MTNERHLVKIELAKQRRTFRQLAASAGLSEATVDNLLIGRSGTQRSKLAITNALGIQIWPEIAPNEFRLPFQAGSIIRFTSVAEADAFAAEVGSIAEQRGRDIRIADDSHLILRGKDGAPHYTEDQLAEMSANILPGEVIEFWSAGDCPPDSAFAPDAEQAGARAASDGNSAAERKELDAVKPTPQRKRKIERERT